MTKEELERQKWNDIFLEDCAVYDKKIAEEYTTLEEQIANLEKKISVLLSCKNCSENKDGYICQKEYEDKCLAQKIQYIKELQEENAELTQENEEMKKGLGCETCQINLEYMSLNNRIAELEKENAELKEKLKPENCLKLLAKEGYIKFSSDQLTYAKIIIQDLLDNTDEYARQKAEDFLKEWE